MSSLSIGLSAQERYVASKTLTTFQEDIFLSAKLLQFKLQKITLEGDTINLSLKDSKKLEQYFLKKTGILAYAELLETNTIKIISQKLVNGQEALMAKEIAKELRALGYNIQRLQRGYQEVLCSTKIPKIASPDALGLAQTPNKEHKNCTDCGSVKLSSSVLEEVKNMDYEMPLLDISFEN